MCIYVHICAYMSIYEHICAYMCIYVHRHMYIYIFVSTLNVPCLSMMQLYENTVVIMDIHVCHWCANTLDWGDVSGA